MNKCSSTPPDSGNRAMSDDIALIRDAMLRVSADDYTVRISGSISCGEFGELAGVFDDMAEKLMKREQRYRSLVENVNDVVFALTPSGVFSYASPQWKLAFGYEISDTIGHPFMPFVHPDDVSGCLEFLSLVVRTGQKQSGVEYRVLCKEGNYLWYTANASLITDPVDGTPMLVAIGRDITERKLAEEALRLSEEKFSAAFRSSPDAITITRLCDSVFLEVNEGFAAMTGYGTKEVVGRSPGELNLLIDPAQEVLLVQTLENKGIVNNTAAHFRRKDGSELIGQLSARIVKIDNEPYVLSITRDITHREQMQKELLKAQKLEAISALAGGIAHNFNNVLTGVIGYISFAKKHLGDPGKLLPLLESAEKSSYRAAALARQLLLFSRGGSPIRKPILVDELVQESVSLFLTGTNICGTVDCEPDQIIFADAQQVSQAFNNIILNAVHAMPEGGSLTVRVNSARLPVGNRHSLPEGDYVEIVFMDSGCGIRNEDLHKIYDPYFTTKESGAGLGLSTTFSIINGHSGRIEITSDGDKGTTATILLPSSAEKPVGDTAAVKRTKQHHKDISILVMDDEKMIRELVDDLLGGQGYEVKTCATGEAAVELYTSSVREGKAYSLVILDLIIPGGIGGVQAAKRILAHNPQAILVVSSGYADDPAVAEYGKYGFSGAIVKPYNSRQLEETIKRLLRRPRKIATV